MLNLESSLHQKTVHLKVATRKEFSKKENVNKAAGTKPIGESEDIATGVIDLLKVWIT